MEKSIYTTRYTTLCMRMREARRAAGLTQVQVAKQLERPQSFVAKYEAGERRLDVIEFLDVAKVIKLDAIELIANLQKIA
ncbi:MAG: helix-turn-helix transcriptional regulator [Kordiimonadaceae bacterium]|nr:helix-turn-helix transcriptional regulator [Kordiimonadaceae bacterium]